MAHFYSRLVCIIGFVLGVLLAISYKKYNEGSIEKEVIKVGTYNDWFNKIGLKKKRMSWDTLRYGNAKVYTESDYLFKNITVLCIIFVRTPNNAKAATNTWARNCNSIKYVHLDLKTSKMMPAKRTKESSSWILLCQALQSVENKFNWVLIVNDYTFVILENLRYFLASLDSSDHHYLGHAVTFWNTIYNTGQAGYVLSRGTLTALQKKLRTTSCSASNAYWNREDFYLGKHLASLNITPVDTRDAEGLSTFFPYNWYHVFFPGENYYKTSFFPTICCSSRAIAFQAIEGDKMYTYHYILYTLQLFLDGGRLGNRSPVTIKPDDEVWKQFLKERNVPIENVSSQQYYQLWEDLVDDPTSFARHMKKEQHFDYD